MKAKILSGLLSIVLSSQLSAQDWPRSHSPAHPAITSIESADARHRYATANYLIDSSIELDRALLTNFAKTAESVAWVLKLLPLPLYAPSNEAKPAITICSSEAEYLKYGGARGTAGYYNGRRNRVVIQWEHFRPKKELSSLIPTANYDLLVHELTHLGMHRHLAVAPPWLTEGTAEYLVAAHTSKGQFDFSTLDRSIRQRLTRNSPPKSKAITVLNLKNTLEMDSRAWQKMTATRKPFETLQAYKSALLLTHFYFHGGKERRDEINQYLKKLLAITRTDQTIPTLASSQSPDDIQQKITTYWKSRGVILDWQ